MKHGWNTDQDRDQNRNSALLRQHLPSGEWLVARKKVSPGREPLVTRHASVRLTLRILDAVPDFATAFL
jgi:hypothetical protein